MIFSLNCKSKKSTKPSINTSVNQIIRLENCQIDTQCLIEIIQNSNIIIKQDEYQNAYIEFEEGDKIIVKYELKRNEPPNSVDGHYSELLYFEIDNHNKQLFLTDQALQNVKMIYGRFCYCKDGTTGYFKVTQGQLKLIKNDKELSIDLKFKVGKIPQIITEIKETIKLK